MYNVCLFFSPIAGLLQSATCQQYKNVFLRSIVVLMLAVLVIAMYLLCASACTHSFLKFLLCSDITYEMVCVGSISCADLNFCKPLHCSGTSCMATYKLSWQ